MHIKRFEGKSLAELLGRIRAELGEDALILETRTSARGRVEVMAARPHADDVAWEPPPPRTAEAYTRLGGGASTQLSSDPQAPAERRPGSSISRVAQILSRLPRAEGGLPDDLPPREAVQARAATEPPLCDLRDPEPGRPADRSSEEEVLQRGRVEYLGRLVRSEHFSVIPLPLRELYLDLVDAEIDANLVFQILSKMGHAPMPGQFATAPPDQLLALLRKLVRTGGTVAAESFPRAMALVGPTGVGKTTTVAKIAGHAAFHLGKRVALVSTDSYRIFGAQHLASYAALMGLEFASAIDAQAMRSVLARRARECDLLLIDTSGRSPRDPEGIAEIQRILAVCPDLDIHLVLAANARVRDQALALERFSVLPIRHLIFTKLDETTRRGGLFTVALKGARPVSYLGTGQDVPDDLEEASIAGLTEAIAETLQKEPAHA